MDYLYKHIITNDTYVLSTKSEGILHSIVVGTAGNGTVTVSDNKGTIAVLKSSVAENTYLYDISWNGFLKVVTTATSPLITIAYK